MTKIYFLNKEFDYERERNAFACQERDTLISKREFTPGSPLVVGFILGAILGAWISSWFIFWACILGIPIISNISKTSEKKKIEEYSSEYQDFLIEIEEYIGADILQPFKENLDMDLNFEDYMGFNEYTCFEDYMGLKLFPI